ncbi:MAG: GNAT family N-acetyltransferase [Gammaproteobacteria bacterium]|nr:GNAT family N-acetyltransferase [Gammaproteobacteria bacterium]
MESVLDDLEYEFCLRPDNDPELGHYVLKFRGHALVYDDELGDERRVAQISGYRLDLGAASVDGIDQNTLLDSVTPEISDFSSTVFKHEGCHYPKNDETGELECDGLVYVDEIKVEPEFRSSGIGKELLKRMSETIDLEHCVVGLKAFPISQDVGVAMPESDIERVKHFYEKLGFERVGGEFMIKDARQCYSMKKRSAWRRAHGIADGE